MKPIILLEQIIDPYTRDNDKSKTTPANSIIIRTKEDLI